MPIKVLVVEDNPNLRLALRSLIAISDDLVCVGDYNSAKPEIEFNRGEVPDVILMDNWIPDDGGIIATQTLKKQEDLKHIPVIYFSANSDIQLLASHAGAETYLAKPFDLEELERKINSLT